MLCDGKLTGILTSIIANCSTRPLLIYAAIEPSTNWIAEIIKEDGLYTERYGFKDYEASIDDEVYSEIF